MNYWSGIEHRWRDALVAAIIPAPGGELPAAADLDLATFWNRFGRVAPIHVRLGFRVAVLLLAGLLPWLLGYFRTLPRLNADQQDAVIQRADRLPLISKLLEVAKLVTCLAYFADPAVQKTVRGTK